LTKRDDNDDVVSRRSKDDKGDLIDRNEEEEGIHFKNVPNMTKPKETSPLKKHNSASQEYINSAESEGKN
jgi:hypothetical protein